MTQNDEIFCHAPFSGFVHHVIMICGKQVLNIARHIARQNITRQLFSFFQNFDCLGC